MIQLHHDPSRLSCRWCPPFLAVSSFIPNQDLASYVNLASIALLGFSENGVYHHGAVLENFFPSKRLLRIHHFQVDPVQVCVFHLGGNRNDAKFHAPCPTFFVTYGDNVWLRGGVVACATLRC